MEREVPIRLRRAVDFHLVEMEIDLLGAGNLEPHEARPHLAFPKLHLQGRRARDAAEVLAFLVVDLPPLFAVVGSEDAERVGSPLAMDSASALALATMNGPSGPGERA